MTRVPRGEPVPSGAMTASGAPPLAGLTSAEVQERVAQGRVNLVPDAPVRTIGEIVQADGLEIDESLLTGEAEAVEKHQADRVLSGSFVAAGSGYYRATQIGADSYASKLANEARRFALAPSELRRGVNKILRW